MTGKRSKHPAFTRQQVQLLYEALHADLDQLSATAIPLVSGLLIAQEALPPALNHWLLGRLAERADLSCTSPAAEAALRIGLLSAHRHEAGVREELQAQFDLIKALRMQDDLENAAQFLTRLALHLELNLSDA